MRSRRGLLPAVLAVSLLVGCGGAERARLYRAEKRFYDARKAETLMWLESATPDSATLMKIRGLFLEVRKEVPGPYGVSADPEKAELDRAIIRLVGTAESKGARLAMAARSPGLAIEAADRLKAAAAGDSALGRRAAFMKLAALHALRRYDDAVAEMKEILGRYPPAPPPPNGEDPILEMPEAIVKLRRQLGQDAAARQALQEAMTYYRTLLERPLEPSLEAQVRARVIRTALELDQPGRALAEADRLQGLIEAMPELRPMAAEVAFARGKIQASTRDLNEGVAILERIATDFPASPYAPRALLEAAMQQERRGRYREAKEGYEEMLRRYPAAPDASPLATYRLGLVQDRLGDWATAKQTLESIPALYPESPSAAEAPVAVIQHYLRKNMRTVARNYFPKALEIYQGLVRRDSTGRYAPVFRAKMINLYLAGNDSSGVYAVTESQVRNSPRHPFTAQMLLEAAKAAKAFGNPDRGAGYLREYLKLFPDSPAVDEVRREIRRLTS